MTIATEQTRRYRGSPDRRVGAHPLDEAPRGYDMFLNKEDNCEKVVLKA